MIADSAAIIVAGVHTCEQDRGVTCSCPSTQVAARLRSFTQVPAAGRGISRGRLSVPCCTTGVAVPIRGAPASACRHACSNDQILLIIFNVAHCYTQVPAAGRGISRRSLSVQCCTTGIAVTSYGAPARICIKLCLRHQNIPVTSFPRMKINQVLAVSCHAAPQTLQQHSMAL